MKHRTEQLVDVQHSTAPSTSSVPVGLGPGEPGRVYDNASGLFRVLEVVTDSTEVRRVLRRNGARFAVRVIDMHAGTEHYTGAIWTGSDRVLKAVA